MIRFRSMPDEKPAAKAADKPAKARSQGQSIQRRPRRRARISWNITPEDDGGKALNSAPPSGGNSAKSPGNQQVARAFECSEFSRPAAFAYSVLAGKSRAARVRAIFAPANAGLGSAHQQVLGLLVHPGTAATSRRSLGADDQA